MKCHRLYQMIMSAIMTMITLICNGLLQQLSAHLSRTLRLWVAAKRAVCHALFIQIGGMTNTFRAFVFSRILQARQLPAWMGSRFER